MALADRKYATNRDYNARAGNDCSRTATPPGACFATTLVLSIFIGQHPPILHMHVSIRPCPPSLLVHLSLTSIDPFFPPTHTAPILSQLFRLPMLSSKLIHQPRVQSQLVHPPLCLIPIALCTLAKPYLFLTGPRTAMIGTHCSTRFYPPICPPTHTFLNSRWSILLYFPRWITPPRH